jgi:hypothetical protein
MEAGVRKTDVVCQSVVCRPFCCLKGYPPRQAQLWRQATGACCEQRNALTKNAVLQGGWSATVVAHCMWLTVSGIQGTSPPHQASLLRCSSVPLLIVYGSVDPRLLFVLMQGGFPAVGAYWCG